MNTFKLVLGTAQFGMKYGLANTHGQLPKEEIFAILDAAVAGGVELFDTAYAYGSAEEVLGEWLSTRGARKQVRIISKMKPHVLNEYPDGTPMVDIVHQEIGKSLKRLGVDKLDGYIFHSPHYVYLKHAIAGLQKAKGRGLVNNIGVSTYDESEALQAVELGMDYVQVPYNVFDQRLDNTDFFELAKKNGATVFARSPFLQGLLLLKPTELPPHLVHARPYLEHFLEITQRHNVPAIEAALLFARNSQAPYVVAGVDELSQLIKDLAVMQEKDPKPELIAELKEAFQHMPQNIVNPILWSKIQQ
ncbi:MAG: aldo/keto reductase [bacterium]|nr:aldo/keto reductase [bacterium]